jgi:hypothetical protein
MKELIPPVPRLSIGRLRSIVLLDTAESRDLTPHYAYLFETQRVKAVFGDRPVVVIGKVDVGSAVLHDPAEEVGGVYVDSVYHKGTLTRIADSLDRFYQITLMIQSAWEGKEELASLEKSPENLSLRDEIIAKIHRSNPESDAGFWNHLAFRELDIRLTE